MEHRNDIASEMKGGIQMFIIKWLLKLYITLKSYKAKKYLQKDYHLIREFAIEHNIHSRTDVAFTVNRNFSYVTDPLFGLVDKLSPLHVLFKKRTGDCDDINWLVTLLFNYLGTKAYFVTVVVWPYTFNHATCVIKPYPDRWQPADYGDLSMPTYLTLEDAVKKIMNMYAESLGVSIKVKWIIVQDAKLNIVDIIHVK